MPITSVPYWLDQLKSDGKLTGTIDAYQRNPMLYRAVNLRSDAISSVPYKVERNGEPSDWYFKTPLDSLLRDTERSLLLTGAAFWLKLVKGNVLIGFRVLNPLTVNVVYHDDLYNPINPNEALTFEQQIGTRKWTFTYDQIIYFREPSLTDEVKHGLAPAEVALQSAQLNYYLERFSSAFFEHGAQPITIMSMPPDVAPAEAERFKNDWTNKISGILNSFRTVFVRGGDIKATVLTPPLKDLMLPELYERTITSISMTLGVPRTMLEASAANYATAESDRKSFWRETIIPRIPLYEHAINSQMMESLGYTLVFQPEALDVMQEDENQRASSLKLLTDAGVPLQDAMVILGFDYELTPTTTLPPSINPDPYVEPEPETVEVDLPETTKSLPRGYNLWRKKLEKHAIAGKSLNFPFVSDDISKEDHDWVRFNLLDNPDSHTIKHLFEGIKATLNDNEKPLYNAVYTALQSIGDSLLLTIAPMVTAGDVVEDAELMDELEVAMRPLIYARMAEHLAVLQDKYTVAMDDAEQASYINQQIDAYMPQMIKGLTDTTYKLVKQVIDNARNMGGMTNEQIASMLAPAFGKQRAMAIAVTEYTRSASMATSVYQGYLNEYGIKTVRVWNTETDEISRKCPICNPLNGKTEDVWGERYPQGAPAHPRCRCDVTIRIVR